MPIIIYCIMYDTIATVQLNVRHEKNQEVTEFASSRFHKNQIKNVLELWGDTFSLASQNQTKTCCLG